ncbi:HD domain-containing protein [candidate division KSB1 bacterium]|nr:HD domain-containing protein [candidate division KSB1 bacterium]NIR71163.1 HD domain-containing protein [candidate division KSB1 bacterium]NIS23293.1 HD domain-containing protein [candidate division KSB1 bacterium]NIT70172.1 HD domain-containing protein [candidate division KSB1 bacterium]NIU23823.1 HD domain-containing protein [candidate division KSB1 bacterium]
MSTNPVIREVERIVEAACASESNVFSYGIWTHHIKQVAQMAKLIAPQFNADPEIVEISALLHDYAGIKDEALAETHHIHGPIEAEYILQTLNYPTQKIRAVKHCIATHRASVASAKRSPEAECLANADAIVHIQQIPSLLNFVYVHRGMDIDEGALWVKNKLKRTWKKLSPQMQDKMWEKYAAALETLTGLETEMT